MWCGTEGGCRVGSPIDVCLQKPHQCAERELASLTRCQWAQRAAWLTHTHTHTRKLHRFTPTLTYTHNVPTASDSPPCHDLHVLPISSEFSKCIYIHNKSSMHWSSTKPLRNIYWAVIVEAIPQTFLVANCSPCRWCYRSACIAVGPICVSFFLSHQTSPSSSLACLTLLSSVFPSILPSPAALSDRGTVVLEAAMTSALSSLERASSERSRAEAGCRGCVPCLFQDCGQLSGSCCKSNRTLLARVILEHLESSALLPMNAFLIRPYLPPLSKQRLPPTSYQSPAVMSSVRPRNFKMKLSGVGLWARCVHTISIAAQLVNWTKRVASGSWDRVAVPVSSSAACWTRCRSWNLLHSRVHRVRASICSQKSIHAFILIKSATKEEWGSFDKLQAFNVLKKTGCNCSCWPSVSLCQQQCAGGGRPRC